MLHHQFINIAKEFSTIITSKALLEKIECPYVEGMIYIEDIMESISEMAREQLTRKSVA